MSVSVSPSKRRATRRGERVGTLLVFDIGGSNTRGGLYDLRTGRIVRRQTIDSDVLTVGGTSAVDPASRLVDGLDRLKRSLIDDAPVIGAVVGFPGPVSDGTVRSAPTLWPGEAFGPFSLRNRLEEAWRGTPVIVLNDVSAAGYAYAAQEEQDFCIVTVSSGIGHKVFIDGEPIVGALGAGGEIGHVRVRYRGPSVRCECGGIDHLGAIASGRGVLRLARMRAAADPRFVSAWLGRACGSPEAITNERIAEAFRAGDPWTVDVVRTGVEPLGWMLGLVRSLVGIERFVVVGGFADALGDKLCVELARAAARADWDRTGHWERRVVPGKLGDDAGLLGAAIAGARAFA
jgi:glucokinase